MRASLNGIVSSDDDLEVYEWFNMQAFSPQSVRKVIQDNPEGEELVLEINSPGGSVFAGGEIYTVLRDASQNTHIRAEIQSLAASAASYLCLGCSEVMISPVALMMVHMPTTATRGDRTDHMRSVGLLDSVREAILNAYTAKAGSGADRAQFRRMMSAETWLTADMARDLGLVDGILYEEAEIPENVMNLAGAGVRAQVSLLGGCRGGLDIVAMREEYRKAKPIESFVQLRDAIRNPYHMKFGEGCVFEGGDFRDLTPEALNIVTGKPEPADGGANLVVIDTGKLAPGAYDITVGKSKSLDWRAKARLELEKARLKGMM